MQLRYIYKILYEKYYPNMYDEKDAFPSVISINFEQEEEEESEDKENTLNYTKKEENEVEKASTPIRTFINKEIISAQLTEQISKY